MHLRYEAVSICFAEFQNPTWNCRGICPLGWQSSMHHWRFVVKTGGSFAFFTLLHGRTLPSAFAPIEWKASVVTHPPTLSIFFCPTHPLSPPLPFLSLLEQPIHRMPILNLLPYAIFTREFGLVLAGSFNSSSFVLFKFWNQPFLLRLLLLYDLIQCYDVQYFSKFRISKKI